MRRSNVLSFPLQLVFPGHSIVKDGKISKTKVFVLFFGAATFGSMTIARTTLSRRDSLC
jgi:hypothetical protein